MGIFLLAHHPKKRLKIGRPPKIKGFYVKMESVAFGSTT